MALLVHDVVEEILEKLPPKSLMRFKSISKQWKSIIESRVFQHKHLTLHRQKSKNPDLLIINTDYKVNLRTSILESIISLELESSISCNIPIPWDNNNFFHFCENSIDGLICLYDDYDSVVIFNPTTRWYRTLPPSTYQQQRPRQISVLNVLGFGKDEINGLYKPVWLYNSDNMSTKCEVFDFNINAWRFIEPSSPKRIIIRGYNIPVYLNGLLYWLTEVKDEEEILSVLSLDLTTETFEIVCCKAPFRETIIFNLNDSLCAMENREDIAIAVIWSLNLEEKKWIKLYNMDVLKLCPFFEECFCEVWPVAFMGGENNKLMLYNYFTCCNYKKHQLMIYDSETTSSHEVFTGGFRARPFCYFRSITSIL